ncbi:MAG TPA: hypothetical protein VEH76_14055 [Methylocystis sp.]|nr:hypothetical protein [Methylocystis sp.]
MRKLLIALSLVSTAAQAQEAPQQASDADVATEIDRLTHEVAALKAK